MASNFTTRPNRNRELSFHQRLLAGDPVAPSELAEEYLYHLSNHLKLKFPKADSAIRDEAAADACLKYASQPESYNPAQRSLWGYLKMSAEGDVRNAQAKQRRDQFRFERLVKFEGVELFTADGNNTIEEDFLMQEELTERIINLKAKTRSEAEAIAETALDQTLLHLLQAGVRRTEEYARILQITQLRPAEQKRIVKNHKDRLRVRLKRHLSRKPPPPEK